MPVVVKNRTQAVPGTNAGAPVAIPDAGLRELAVALGKSEDTAIHAHDRASFEVLDAHGAGIADLSGLEGAINLQALQLGNNPITDLRVLSRLPRLTTLILDDTGADPWAIAGLTTLTRLSLRSNGIVDAMPLARLKQLEALDIGGNKLTDLSGLAPLSRLRVLRAHNNAIASIAPLVEMTALETADLRNTSIEDISPLANLEARIDIRGNPPVVAVTR